MALGLMVVQFAGPLRTRADPSSQFTALFETLAVAWLKAASKKAVTEGQRTGIEAVAMDMWDPCVESVRDHVTEADQKMVFDKFHVSQHLSQAVGSGAGRLQFAPA